MKGITIYLSVSSVLLLTFLLTVSSTSIDSDSHSTIKSEPQVTKDPPGIVRKGRQYNLGYNGGYGGYGGYNGLGYGGGYNGLGYGGGYGNGYNGLGYGGYGGGLLGTYGK